MSTMSIHAEPAAPLAPWEITEAGKHGEHGAIILSVTVDGEIMAVCSCAIVGFGADEETARSDMRASHPGFTISVCRKCGWVVDTYTQDAATAALAAHRVDCTP
jgi:hypothetical protein